DPVRLAAAGLVEQERHLLVPLRVPPLLRRPEADPAHVDRALGLVQRERQRDHVGLAVRSDRRDARQPGLPQAAKLLLGEEAHAPDPRRCPTTAWRRGDRASRASGVRRPATASATIDAENPLVGEMCSRSWPCRQNASQAGQADSTVGAVSWYAT